MRTSWSGASSSTPSEVMLFEPLPASWMRMPVWSWPGSGVGVGVGFRVRLRVRLRVRVKVRLVLRVRVRVGVRVGVRALDGPGCA